MTDKRQEITKVKLTYKHNESSKKQLLFVECTVYSLRLSFVLAGSQNSKLNNHRLAET